MEFDRQGICGALSETDLDADEETVTLLGKNLRTIAQCHHKRRREENGALTVEHDEALERIWKAASTILATVDADAETWTGPLEIMLTAFDPHLGDHLSALRGLQSAAKQARAALHEDRRYRITRTLETLLFLDIYDLYSQLLAYQGKIARGKSAPIGNGGPTYRFTKACVELITGGSTEFPNSNNFRSRLMDAAAAPRSVGLFYQWQPGSTV